MAATLHRFVRLLGEPFPLALFASAFAFAWCWTVGGRGFFPLDQSIAMDGAWRLQCGQVPFVDLWTPHGLPLMAAVALAFECFGVGHGTYLGCAAFTNALAALLVWSLVRRGSVVSDAQPQDESRLGRLAAGCAALLTAFWFQAPHGTPFSEQAAFLCALATWRAVLCRRGRAWSLPAAGALAWMALLCKQNAGLLSLGVSLFLLAQGEARRASSAGRDLGRFLVGFLLAMGAFGLWLVARSDPAVFWRSYVQIPSGLLSERFGRGDLVERILLGRGNDLVPLVMLLCGLPALLLWRRGGRRAVHWRGRFGWHLALHLHHNLFVLLTVNHPENGYPFVGLSVGLWMAAIPELTRPGRWRRASWLLAACIVCAVSLRGARVGWLRIVHRPVFEGARFEDVLPRDGWRSLRWGEPTRHPAGEYHLADLMQLVERLEARPGSVFVFPEHSFLYALLRRAPPQPLLWFDAGVTYPALGKRTASALRMRMGACIVEDLVRHDVRTVVLEEDAFLDADGHLAAFPDLAEFLGERFELLERIGAYSILVRR